MQRKRGDKIPRAMAQADVKLEADTATIRAVETAMGQSPAVLGARARSDKELANWQAWKAKFLEVRMMGGQYYGSRAKLPNGLTLGQESFCQNIMGGMTHAEAYREAYNARNIKPAVVYQRAYLLTQSPKVQARLSELWTEREAKLSLTGAQLRLWVTERLMIEATDKNNTGSTRVRAVELVGKIGRVNLFAPEDSEGNAQHTTDKAKLEQRLKALLDQAQAEAKGKRLADYSE